MLDPVFSEFKQNCDKALESLMTKFSGIRGGRATPALVEHILVDTYGSKMPLKSLATITAPEPRLITIQPWDRNNMQAIEKAIMTSNLGLTPQTEAQLIRIVIPSLTTERREEYIKIAKQEAEKTRVIIRGYRKEAMDKIRKQKVDKEISEDEETRGKEELQSLVDAEIEKVDQHLEKKITDLEQI